MATFITPYSGSANLSAANGLEIVSQGRWLYNEFDLESRDSFYLSLAWPKDIYNGDFYYGAPNTISPADGGLLHLSATNWNIAVIGNELTSYTDPDTHVTYGPERCRIEVRGQWLIMRKQNSDSFNSIGVIYSGATETDQGRKDFGPQASPFGTGWDVYVKQGAACAGGAIDTFSDHTFYCRITELARTNNSNKIFTSNTLTIPVYSYTYSKSWQTD